MEDDDRLLNTSEERILPDQEIVNEDSNRIIIETPSCIARIRQYITIEPVVFLYFLAFIPTYPLSQQYVYMQFSLKYNLTEDEAKERNSSCLVNTSDPVYQKQQLAQEDTSWYMIYLNMAFLIPSCFCVAFLGAYTDKVGRKKALLMPLVTGTLRSWIYILVIQLKLNMNYLLVANIIDGLSGGTTSILTCCFAYIADITSKSQRTLRIYMIELGIGLGIAMSQIYTGYMIDALGYVYPFLLIEAIYTVNLLFVIFYIQESITHKEETTLFTLQHIKETAKLFIKDDGSNRRWKLQLLIIILTLSYMVDIGSGDVYTFYILSRPFCFTPVLIGYFNAVQYFLRVFGTFVFLKIFAKWLRDVGMMIIGTASGIAAQIIMAFATMRLLVFLSPVAGMLVSLVVPLIRSYASKLVQPTQQGAMSASISLAQQISSLLGALVFDSVYSKTTHIFHGFVFFITAAVYATSMLLMIALLLCIRREEKREETSVSSDAN